jgi:hypothetical protein
MSAADDESEKAVDKRKTKVHLISYLIIGMIFDSCFCFIYMPATDGDQQKKLEKGRTKVFISNFLT